VCESERERRWSTLGVCRDGSAMDGLFIHGMRVPDVPGRGKRKKKMGEG